LALYFEFTQLYGHDDWEAFNTFSVPKLAVLGIEKVLEPGSTSSVSFFAKEGTQKIQKAQPHFHLIPGCRAEGRTRIDGLMGPAWKPILPAMLELP